MPDLYHSLLAQDIGHLRILADQWGLELASRDVDPAAKELAAALLDAGRAADTLDVLPAGARLALAALSEARGRLPWAGFARKFGEIREMGAGRRDRERPHLNPASPAEALFYRALIGRAFFDTPSGPQEFAYIPDDLLEVIGRAQRREKQEIASANTSPPGRAATPAERAHAVPADDSILDQSTTLLAAVRLGHPAPPDEALQGLLSTAGLIKKGIPQAERVRAFLEAPRTEALAMLVQSWKASEAFNELRLVPGLVCEGEWKNPPLATRQALLSLIGSVPHGKWWSLPAFISDIRKFHPDFQRPAGDYDSWFIKRASDGVYLRGFGSWDEVDGALARYFITGVLHRLAMVDLAAPGAGREPSAFRIPESRPARTENGKWKPASNGRIAVPVSVPRAARYQLARFCEWEQARPDGYDYRITPGSLREAGEQGLTVEQLIPLLVQHAAAGIPPVLVKALKNWEANGTEARVEAQLVLRVGRPEVLQALRKSGAARFLGEILGPTAVVIKPGAQSRVMAALAEMGLLAEDHTGLPAHAAGAGKQSHQ
jgi:hypothetical protein